MFELGAYKFVVNNNWRWAELGQAVCRFDFYLEKASALARVVGS